MPYRICKTFEVESGHLLTKHPDRCRFPHGHTRQVEVVVEANDLDARDMVCDFKALKAALAPLFDRFDHALCMNVSDPNYAAFRAAYGERVIPFEGGDPTTEAIARTLFNAIAAALDAYRAAPTGDYPIRSDVRLARVRVWETSSTWAEYQTE